jgi:hypothetical protein
MQLNYLVTRGRYRVTWVEYHDTGVRYRVTRVKYHDTRVKYRDTWVEFSKKRPKTGNSGLKSPCFHQFCPKYPIYLRSQWVPGQMCPASGVQLPHFVFIRCRK